MIVSEIYDDVRSVTNFADESLNLSRISDAIEVISNKGNYDVLLGYLTTTAVNGLITLPPDVQVPLKVNIDGNPAFTRDKLYEFTLNGPGQNTERVDWSWEDRGLTPIMRPLKVPSKIMVVADPRDNGKTITISGRDNSGQLQSLTFILGTNTTPSNSAFSTIENVVKDVTLKTVNLTTDTGFQISQYAANETNPQYRQIRISKDTGTAYILFRKNNVRVTSQSDFIPVRSRMGLIYMVKALQAYRDDNVDLGNNLEQQALQMCNDEQASNNAQIQIATDAENASIRNLNYNNIDSVIVADIYDEACKIVGAVGETQVYDKITEAISILGRKAQWDSLRGYVDIFTDQYEFVTLPRYCEYPIRVNINTQPAVMNNKWFEFHLSGPGENWLPANSWTDNGEVVTVRDVQFPIKLTAIPDIQSDTGKEIRVFGFSAGKRLQTITDSGISEDGVIVPCDVNGTNFSVMMDRIERITKESSNGFIKMLAVDANGQNEFTVGYYYPDETEPRYRRIKISPPCSRVRIMYRRRQLKISALTDPIHLRSKAAVLIMMRGMEALNKGDFQTYTAMEATAVKLVMDEQLINNQTETRQIDFGRTFTPSNQFIRV